MWGQVFYQWYEKESGQKVEEKVVDRLFYETGGQPDLTCWLGELLTEGLEDYPNDTTRPVDMTVFDSIYAAAVDALPNNNILYPQHYQQSNTKTLQGRPLWTTIGVEGNYTGALR